MTVGLCRRITSQRVVLLMILTGAAASGCNSGAPARVSKADVDPDAVAARALELWDGNSDGAIDKDEAAAKCAPLAGVMAAYDADGDGKITAAELAGHIKSASGSGASLTGAECTVFLAGRPLAGATVKLRPVEMYDDELLPAEGTTNEQGITRPSIGADNLPEKLAAAALIYPGLYHVEITHATTVLPAKYNETTELGWEVDPSARSGSTVRFDLKP